MQYCLNMLLVRDDHDIEKIITLLAIECFQARDSYRLDSSQFNIDCGQNDVRAIVNFDKRQIKLCCRYSKDVGKTDFKISQFAGRYSHLCKLVSYIQTAKNEVDPIANNDE